MKKLKKKLNWAIGLSISAIILSVVMLIIWCCNAEGFEVVELDTFVGVIVALLAIIVTIVLGWQIINTMEIKSKIEYLNELDNKIKEQQKKHKETTTVIGHLLDLTWAEQSINNSEYGLAFPYCVRSLRKSMQLTKCQNVNKLLQFMEISASEIHNNYIINNESIEEMKQDDRIIREQNNFNLIKDKYEESYNLFFKKIKLDDTQK